jgi:hypothetical protein
MINIKLGLTNANARRMFICVIYFSGASSILRHISLFSSYNWSPNMKNVLIQKDKKKPRSSGKNYKNNKNN